MDQGHLNFVLDRTTEFYLKVRSHDAGILAKFIGTYTREDHRKAESQVGLLGRLLSAEDGPRRVMIAQGRKTLETNINYAYNVMHHETLDFLGVHNDAFFEALEYLSRRLNPRPIRPAA